MGLFAHRAVFFIISFSMLDFSGLMRYLPKSVADAMERLPGDYALSVEEMRLRAGCQTLLISRMGNRKIGDMLSADALNDVVNVMCRQSRYAYEERINAGFIPLPGGYRAGICGRVALRGGVVIAVNDISSVNIRIARQIIGCADNVIAHIADERIHSTLILSPPGLGKTTMLRDIARSLSMRGYQVGICDERSEIAACLSAIPQLDVGRSTDVLDGCLKAVGISWLIRAMRPDVIITDELGGQADALAVLEASRCGVSVIASAHARTFSEAQGRGLTHAFERVIILGGAPGRVVSVTDGKGGAL